MAHSDALIEVDFEADWIEHLSARLLQLGYSPLMGRYPRTAQQKLEGKPATKVPPVDVQFYNVAHRLIWPQPRRVVYASTFDCPAELAGGLQQLHAEVERGDNLRRRLSRGVGKIRRRDLLLNDWGITHFHLGRAEDIATGDQIAGTEQVAFAHVDDQTVRFIMVGGHVWTDTSMLEIIHREWPEVTASRRLEGVTGRALSTAEIAAIRRKHGNVVALLADGTVLAPLGGGTMSDGGSARALLSAEYERHRLRCFEQDVVANARAVIKALDVSARPARFQLVVVGDGTFRVRALGCPGELALVAAPEARAEAAERELAGVQRQCANCTFCGCRTGGQRAVH